MLTPTRLVALPAAAVAAVLLTFYVGLLHEAVDRGVLARSRALGGAAVGRTAGPAPAEPDVARRSVVYRAPGA